MGNELWQQMRNKKNFWNTIANRFMFFLPERDDLGRKVIFYRPGVSDPMSPTVGYDSLILSYIAYEMVCAEEENQITGVVHIVDAKGIRPPHFTVFSPQFSYRVGKNSEVSVRDETLKTSTYIFLMSKFDISSTQKTLPMRHKGFHVMNIHKSLNFISNFILSHMNEKLRKRTQLYSSFKEFKAINKKFLPKEYGGKIPMSEMIGKFV